MTVIVISSRNARRLQLICITIAKCGQSQPVNCRGPARPMAIEAATRARLCVPIRAEPRPALSGAGEQERRSAFRRDCDRIIHSTAFRRLAAQDPGVRLPRGRPLPHPAHPHARGGADRPLARPRAGLDEDLAEGAGACARSRPSAVRPRRRARARLTASQPFGGFDHNAQTPARRDRAGAPLSRPSTG